MHVEMDVVVGRHHRPGVVRVRLDVVLSHSGPVEVRGAATERIRRGGITCHEDRRTRTGVDAMSVLLQRQESSPPLEGRRDRKREVNRGAVRVSLRVAVKDGLRVDLSKALEPDAGFIARDRETLPAVDHVPSGDEEVLAPDLEQRSRTAQRPIALQDERNGGRAQEVVDELPFQGRQPEVGDGNFTRGHGSPHEE